MTTKNNQHRGSFENLALSGHGDEIIIAKIDKLVHNHQIAQPYSRNVLLRIDDLIHDYLDKEKFRHQDKENG